MVTVSSRVNFAIVTNDGLATLTYSHRYADWIFCGFCWNHRSVRLLRRGDSVLGRDGLREPSLQQLVVNPMMICFVVVGGEENRKSK